MAIDLQNQTNIGTGWGRPPDYSAPNIGGLVGDILRNRIAQREQQQKEIAYAVKQIQQQQQDKAYSEALRNAGLTEGQDISGLDSGDATRLATLLQARTPDAQRDALLAAQTAAINRGEGRGGSRGPRPFTQGQQFNALKTQQSILGKQAGEIEQEQEDYGLQGNKPPPQGFGYMKNEGGGLRYATTPEEQANPDFISPTDVLNYKVDPKDPKAYPTVFTPQEYQQRRTQSDLRQKILAQQKDVQAKILAPPTDSGTGGDGGPTGPPVGTKGVVGGKPAVWDGRGWLPDTSTTSTQ